MHLGQSISFTSMFSDIWFYIFLNWKQKICFYYNHGDILLYLEMFCNLRYALTMASFKHNHTFSKSGLQFNQTHFNASHYLKYIFNKESFCFLVKVVIPLNLLICFYQNGTNTKQYLVENSTRRNSKQL
jgi:hypothetical protein